jgi:hypothetical protein
MLFSEIPPIPRDGIFKNLKLLNNYLLEICTFNSNKNLEMAIIIGRKGLNLPSINGSTKYVNEERFSQISH